MTGRVDVHHHVFPDFYRDALWAAGIAEAGGRALPQWSADAASDLRSVRDYLRDNHRGRRDTPAAGSRRKPGPPESVRNV